MKVRVVLITENDVPVEALGENPAEKIKRAWDAFFALNSLASDNGDKGYVEAVEIMDGDNE